MAKRTDIRRFQEELAKRLAAAEQQPETVAARWLAVTVATQPLLLPLVATAGVVHEFTLTPVPFSPPHFRGLTSVRGEVMDILDLAPLMGAPPTPPSGSNRLILLQPQIATRVALLVDRVVGLRRAEELERATAAAPLSEGIRAVWQSGGELWHELDLPFWIREALERFGTVTTLAAEKRIPTSDPQETAVI